MEPFRQLNCSPFPLLRDCVDLVSCVPAIIEGPENAVSAPAICQPACLRNSAIVVYDALLHSLSFGQGCKTFLFLG